VLKYSNLEKAIPTKVYQGLFSIVTEYKINTPSRLAHFLAQCAHESTNFSRVEENLNYSARRLMVVFKKYFLTEELALQYERNPKAIASRVYANRMGNGPEETNDGWTYRGRGFIQLTGRDNYKLFDGVVNDNITDNPDLVANKYSLVSAAWFWNNKKLNDAADQGITENEVALITKKVNGGFIGLEDRTKLFHKFYNLLNKE
jgi:putative chitinase